MLNFYFNSANKTGFAKMKQQIKTFKCLTNEDHKMFFTEAY